MKIAMVLLYNYIRVNGLFGTVKMVLNVHDEIVVEFPEDMENTWVPTQKRLMKQAADVVVPSGLLDCEIKTAYEWAK